MLLCIIPTNMRLTPEILKELERQRRPSDLFKQSIIENFNVPWNTPNWPSMAILNNDLLHGTVHHPTKLEADNRNP